MKRFLLLCPLLFLSGCSQIKPLSKAASAPPLRALNQSREPVMKYMFNQTPLETVLDMYGELTGRSMILDPAVSPTRFSQSNEVKSTRQKVVEDIDALLAEKGIAISALGGHLAIVHPKGTPPTLPQQSRFMPPGPEGETKEQMLTLNQVDLKRAARLYMQLSKRPVLVPKPLPKDRFFFRSRQKMSPSETAHALEALLVINGYTMEEQGEFITLYKEGSSDPATLESPNAPFPKVTPPAPPTLPGGKVVQPPKMLPLILPPPKLPRGKTVQVPKEPEAPAPRPKTPAEEAQAKALQAHLLEYQREVIRRGLPTLPNGKTIKEQQERFDKAESALREQSPSP